MLTAGRGKPCTSICTAAGGAKLDLYDVEKSYLNAGLPECQEKFNLTSAFLPVVSCVSPAPAFRHQGQSVPGTAGHGLDRHCPAMEKSFMQQQNTMQ